MNKRILLFILVGLFLFTGCSTKEDVMFAEEKVDVTEQLDMQSTVSEEKMIYVYVCGHVKQPGVYALKVDSRICDALELAGGVTEDAKPEALDQAKYVDDGQTIYVPGAEDANEMSDDGLVDINEADKETLMTLPGIGESKADIIIQYREEQGGFHSIEDLMNIPGIKEGVFNKIKDGIKVS